MRVLCVRLSAMGDVVQTLGAVEALRRARPEWELTFVTQRPFAPLLAGLPGVAAVVPFDRRAGLRGVLALRAELRRRRFDVALDLQGNWKSAFVARLAGARQSLGMAGPWRQEPGSRVLLRRTIAGSGLPHPARTAFELVRALAPEAPFSWPRLLATPAELDAEVAALRRLGIDARLPFRVVVVTAAADARALSAAAIAAFVGSLRSPPPVVAVLGPAGAGLAAPAGLPALRHAPGELRRLVALGALVARTGGAVLGPDQGATHVLAAAGARCDVMFGAQDPLRTAPPAAAACVHPAPPDCSPCRQTRCRHVAGPVCMDFTLVNARRVDIGLPPPAAEAAHG